MCVYACIMHKVSKYMYLNACFVLGNYKKFFNLDWSFNEKLLCVYMVICFVLIIRALLSHVVMISLFFFLSFSQTNNCSAPPISTSSLPHTVSTSHPQAVQTAPTPSVTLTIPSYTVGLHMPPSNVNSGTFLPVLQVCVYPTHVQ